MKSSYSPLAPSPTAFQESFPDWTASIGELIANAEAGTVFGLFGPWGSGKSSAALALADAVVGRNDIGDLVAAVVVECSSLPPDQGQLREAIEADLKRFDTSADGPMGDLLHAALRRAVPAAKELAPDPISKAATIATGLILDARERRIEAERTAKVTQIPSRLDLAVVFLDDLDRCDPPTAWSLLRTARTTLRGTRTVMVVVCDPAALGHHVGRELSLPPADGFEAVLKYIDVPLRIPVRVTATHERSVFRLVPDHLDRYAEPLREVAAAAARRIPFRQVLTALPQAVLWLERIALEEIGTGDAKNTGTKIAEVVLFAALLHTCVPTGFEILLSAEPDRFHSLLQTISGGLTGPTKTSAQSEIQRDFGGGVQDIIESRMDLVHLAKAFSLGKGLSRVSTGR